MKSEPTNTLARLPLQGCLHAISVRAPKTRGHLGALAAMLGEKGGLVAQVATRLLSIAFATGIALVCTHPATALTPQAVPYVGELTFLDGSSVNATLDFEVTLFATATGDTPLWGPYSFPGIAVESGIFSVILGDFDTEPLDNALMASDTVWVEFAINGVSLSPRHRVLSVPYARISSDAAHLGGVGANEYVLLQDLGAAALSNSYNDLNDLPTLLEGPPGPAGPTGPAGPPGADGIDNVNTGSGLTGGPLTTGSTIAVATGGITSDHIADSYTILDVHNSAGQSMFTTTDGQKQIQFVGSGAAVVAFDGVQRRVTISSAGDITGVTAGVGLTGGADTGNATLSLAAPTATTLGGVKAFTCTGTNNKMTGIDSSGTVLCGADANSGGTVTAVTATGVLSSSGGNTPQISFTGTLGAANGGTGLSAVGTAGNFLRSNGTTWASAAISANDLPSNSTAYIQNQTAANQTGGFKLTGEGTLGGNLTVSGGTLTLNAATSNAISFASQGVAAPSATSVGWKIKTWSTLYGIGIDSGTQWYSADGYHRWYTTNGTTWTKQLELDNTGKLTFRTDPGGGSGDEASLRYYAKADETTRFAISVGNDTDDEIAFVVGGQDRMVLVSGRMNLRVAPFQVGCPSGYTLHNSSVCTRFPQLTSNWTDAQITCAADGARICTYKDVLLSWQTAGVHPISRNGDWLGDFVADDEVLIVNGEGNKYNFEGTAGKGGSRQYVCCIDPR